MINLVKLADIAQHEFEKSTLWYKGESGVVGQRFVEDVFKAFNSISRNPEFYPKKKGNNREFVMRKFPFVIVYEYLPKQDSVFILHIFHTSRNPKLKYRRK
ncbi:type II toxin-antitoxin system RelE/ParE family toxin [Mucilaginibacter sp.]|uniref:type II toxin-antitoxin system RelE/ParE family toxin n=1 Tax=Mucilaginibacter sp. TaxID=1882438 RepID=UPI0028476ADF|nr:type II toxin-antitoxin system RelE/ParE family toxin [Mucilaginibacter sp.]MDR3696382.1 type II toxin-antitoxin system RelE/ParE family toxin [Mucilaginibacter sp.]